MIIKVKCPASCGELIQGLVGDGEKLISLPIDIYSQVTLCETKEPKLETKKVKMRLALEKTFKYFHISKKYMENISLSLDSSIPIAKGMASSTADIAATVIATARFLGKEISFKELGELCCEIEPTDSTIFQRLTLFDHINGRIIEEYDWNPKIKVLILEMDRIVNTEEFRRTDYSDVRIKNKNQIEKAYRIFSSGCKMKDKRLLGKAVTISSLMNQEILYKPKLDEILDISIKLGAYGVNVAHSGTVIGILYDESQMDINEFKYIIGKRKITKYYTKIYSANMIKGGVRIIK
ncbi:GHMP family kinase ATP-binding protein [Maledivibacter halophilus]|uniref:Threonine kinase n=1 Tax=Maledivibacter halophilus TaxID=36842 RepID=A0A1T5LI68_9FIRM|nr:hypothetical protein [Maledivibacter halophilus]SKC75693.1 threonine kinase [Maledivibacter halophilus]